MMRHSGNDPDLNTGLLRCYKAFLTAVVPRAYLNVHSGYSFAVFVCLCSSACSVCVCLTLFLCMCGSCAHNTQVLITVQLLVFFPVEQQSEAFSAKALVNNSGLILFAAVGRNKTGH